MKFILVVLAVVAAAHTSNGAVGLSVPSLITELNNLESAISSQIGQDVEASGKLVSNALVSVNSMFANAIATGAANSANCAAAFSASEIELVYNNAISNCINQVSDVASIIDTAVNSLKTPLTNLVSAIATSSAAQTQANAVLADVQSCIDTATSVAQGQAQAASTTAYKCLFPIG